MNNKFTFIVLFLLYSCVPQKNTSPQKKSSKNSSDLASTCDGGSRLKLLDPLDIPTKQPIDASQLKTKKPSIFKQSYKKFNDDQTFEEVSTYLLTALQDLENIEEDIDRERDWLEYYICKTGELTEENRTDIEKKSCFDDSLNTPREIDSCLCGRISGLSIKEITIPQEFEKNELGLEIFARSCTTKVRDSGQKNDPDRIPCGSFSKELLLSDLYPATGDPNNFSIRTTLDEKNTEVSQLEVYVKTLQEKSKIFLDAVANSGFIVSGDLDKSKVPEDKYAEWKTLFDHAKTFYYSPDDLIGSITSGLAQVVLASQLEELEEGKSNEAASLYLADPCLNSKPSNTVKTEPPKIKAPVYSDTNNFQPDLTPSERDKKWMEENKYLNSFIQNPNTISNSTPLSNADDPNTAVDTSKNDEQDRKEKEQQKTFFYSLGGTFLGLAGAYGVYKVLRYKIRANNTDKIRKEVMNDQSKFDDLTSDDTFKAKFEDKINRNFLGKKSGTIKEVEFEKITKIDYIKNNKMQVEISYKADGGNGLKKQRIELDDADLRRMDVGMGSKNTYSSVMQGFSFKTAKNAFKGTVALGAMAFGIFLLIKGGGVGLAQDDCSSEFKSFCDEVQAFKEVLNELSDKIDLILKTIEKLDNRYSENLETL